MGVDIRVLFDDSDEHMAVSTSQLAALVDGVRRLSGEDLKTYFEMLFCRMNSSSKEAMTQIMWTSLSTGEQHRFEMPCGRENEGDIVGRLENSFNINSLVQASGYD